MTRTRPAERPTAPEDLEIPPYVTTWLGHRDRSVLAHGFTQNELKTTWWTDAIRSEGLAPGKDVAITLPPTMDGPSKLTRSALFDMAKRLDAHDDDDQWLVFLWHVLAWGSGRSRRNNRARIRAFADPANRGDRVLLLRQAAEHARGGDTRSAYSTLIRPGGGTIPAFGPAFFTKFLYFAAGDGPCGEAAPAEGRRCLIFDARVARNLHAAGWTTLPHRRSSFSANWYTDTYVSYCDLLHRWAVQQSELLGAPVAPDEFERALFTGRSAHPDEIGQPEIYPGGDGRGVR
ncbi:hypothetical protein GCM10028784_16880 [Myceligenerans cantabricum]